MKKIATVSYVLAVLLLHLKDVQAGEITAQQEQQIKAEIKDLVHDYAVYRDNLNAEDYANTFLEDGRFILGGETFEGRDVLHKRIENTNPNVVSMHIMSTGQIDVVDENNATGIQYATVYSKSLAEPHDENQASPIDGFAVMGKYHDKYERTANGWKFAERRMQPVFTAAK